MYILENLYMRHELNNDILTLFFEGELNSYNADSVEKDIEETLVNKSFKELVLDFSNLKYVSSAGLRIILKLKQKYNKVRIIEASLEVYDVLSMTGFINIMEVKKAIKKISIENASVIGEGFFSTVYRIDKDTIIKVFNRTSDPNQIERELKLSKQAFILGIPTAISFDIVKVGDKFGVRFEMLDCMSLKQAFIDHPEKYHELIVKYANLLKKINTTECIDASLPKMNAFFMEKLEKIKPYLDAPHYQKLKNMLASIPSANTFVHGDCHFKNIMMQGDGLLLIDMDTLSIGKPIFELALIRAPYVAFEEDDPGNCQRFLGLPAEFCKKMYLDIVKEYLGREDQAALDKIALVCYVHMVWWTLMNTPEDNKRIKGCSERLIKLINQYDDLDIGI